MKLYDAPVSGNGYKVRLALAQLQRAYDYVVLDLAQGQTRTPQFLSLNPNGRIPVLQLDDGAALAESNAILYYLAQGTALWPASALDQARALQWMFFEQYSHEPHIATARYWLAVRGGALTAFETQQLQQKRVLGDAALAVMQGHLSTHDYFAGPAYSVADIALYAYTHTAHEGGFDLARYPAVQAWLARVAAQPRHVTIEQWR